jgi:hypothetical protein
VNFRKDRFHLVDVGVEVGSNDGRKRGVLERKVAYVSTHEMRHSYPSHAELVGRMAPVRQAQRQPHKPWAEAQLRG